MNFLRHPSLPAQLIIGFIALVILTTLVTGLPALWLLRGQLDRQAWSQVEQGRRAAQALVQASREELQHEAALIASRPTLLQLLDQGDTQAAVEYLHSLQKEAGLDLLAVCQQGHPVFSTGESADNGLCLQSRAGYYQQTSKPESLWLTAAQPVGNDPAALLVAGVRLDQAYAAKIHDKIGLDFTLLVDGAARFTSLEAGTADLVAAPQKTLPAQTAGNAPCTTFEVNCLPYYAARLPVAGSDIEAEVALEVSAIRTAQTRLAWVLAASMLGVAVLGSLASLVLARRLSRPLVNLAESAERFSQGDLDSPVPVEAEVREEVMVARALENARIDLLRNMTELRREKDWVTTLLEAIIEGIVTLDKSCRITFFSRGAERITGWSRAQVLGRSSDDVFKLAEGGAPFSQSLPGPGRQARLLVQMADGRQANLAISGAQLPDADTGEVGLALVFRDVSEQESIHRLLGQFMANVAHEFRTPLAALAASAELLLDQTAGYSAEESQALLKSLHLGIISLGNLVDNLLESASIEAGHFRVSPRPYDLDAIIQEAAGTMHPLLEKYGQRLVLDLPEQIPLVQADPRRMVQVLVNLLSNASKYGPEDAPITLRASRSAHWVQVSVVDRGPGVPEEMKADVFRRFLYPRSPDLHTKVGAGLGLSVVKAVVEAHGGKVGVEDSDWGGAVFWFSLPVAEDA